jgi:hypothetical protein
MERINRSGWYADPMDMTKLCTKGLAAVLSVAGLCFLSPDIAAAIDAGPPIVQTPLGPAREAPIGHRQPRPSDLPPSVQHDEQLDQPAQKQPQNQTPNRGGQAASVPTIDAQKGCEAAEKDMGAIFGPNGGPTVGTCLKQEDDARQEIVNKWTTYPPGDRQKCINTTAYLPSYVEWITCLEMYRDLRSLERAPQDQVQQDQVQQDQVQTSGSGHRRARHR